jgi:hypothetical protein
MQKNILNKTRAFTYVMPCITDFVQINKNSLVNCFLGVEGINSTYDGNVYLVFEFNPDQIEYEDYLIKNENIILHKDLNATYYLVGVEIPITYYSSVYCNYIEGKFSQFPQEYKNKILKYHSLGISSLQSKILNNHPSLKSELCTSLKIAPEYITEVGEMPTFESDCLYNYMYTVSNTSEYFDVNYNNKSN